MIEPGIDDEQDQKCNDIRMTMSTPPYRNTDPNKMGVQCFHAKEKLMIGGKTHLCGGKGHYLCKSCSDIYFPDAVYLCYKCMVAGSMLSWSDTSPRGKWASSVMGFDCVTCLPGSFHKRAVKAGLMRPDRIPDGDTQKSTNVPAEITKIVSIINSNPDHYKDLNSAMSGIPVSISSKRRVKSESQLMPTKKQVIITAADVPISTVQQTAVVSSKADSTGKKVFVVDKDEKLKKMTTSPEFVYLKDANNKRFSHDDRTTLHSTINADLNSDDFSIPSDVTVGAVSGNPFVDSDAEVPSPTIPSTPCSIISDLLDMSPISFSMLNPSVIDASVLDASASDASVIDSSVKDTSVIDSSVIDASVKDASKKKIRYMCMDFSCSHCHGPVQRGRCPRGKVGLHIRVV